MTKAGLMQKSRADSLRLGENKITWNGMKKKGESEITGQKNGLHSCWYGSNNFRIYFTILE